MFPDKVAAVIQVIEFPEPSTILHDVQVQTPVGVSKQFVISRVTEVGLVRPLE